LIDINDRAAINPIRQAYLGEHRRASTLFEVSALVSPEMKVEIEIEAVVTNQEARGCYLRDPLPRATSMPFAF